MVKTRIIIDTLMILMLPILMAYSLVGENTHEIVGICMFIVFLIHNIINYKWWKLIFRGKYTMIRTLKIVINIFLLIYMILQPISGILMSKHVLKEVSMNSIIGTTRMIHMTLAYWGFVIMSFHLGLNVKKISISLMKKKSDIAKKIIMVIVMLISVYGIYSFIKYNIYDYLIMNSMFVSLNYGVSKIRFVFEYIMIIVLIANISYWVQKGLYICEKNKSE